jgi:hypothetical protein
LSIKKITDIWHAVCSGSPARNKARLTTDWPISYRAFQIEIISRDFYASLVLKKGERFKQIPWRADLYGFTV